MPLGIAKAKAWETKFENPQIFERLEIKPSTQQDMHIIVSLQEIFAAYTQRLAPWEQHTENTKRGSCLSGRPNKAQH